MNNNYYCDGIERRDFIKVGALAGLGVSLPQWISQSQAGEIKERKSKAAIFVRLTGGPSHMDTFDMKPNAPSTHKGEFNEISTKVPGIKISEHLPKLAKCTDKFAIVRGISHSLAAHQLGQQYLASGNRPIASLQYPTYGSVVAKELGGPEELPPFIAIPNQNNNPTGFLGVEYGPFDTGATPQKGRPMRVRGLASTPGMSLDDIERKQNLISRYDKRFGSLKYEDKILAGMDEFSRKAYLMMRSPAAKKAFDLAKEPNSIGNLFGAGGFSQSCLLSTRLVEAGVPFVTISYGGWDTHQDNFNKLKDVNLPELDDGLAGLFQTLELKGLLESTTVFVSGEFGRTPKINARGGRDHYPRAMFSLFAGGGIDAGQVVGESDKNGEGPKDWKITPDDLAATLYYTLGIDYKKEYHTPTGRPVMIVRDGSVIRELLS